MPASAFLKRRSKFSLSAVTCILFASGAATLAQADWRNSTLSRVESELRQQSLKLAKLNEPWAQKVKSRADFAIYKISNALMSASPAAEFTHMEHACQALIDERTLLIPAQSEDSHNAQLIDQLIEQTFEHREALGCRE